MSQHVRFCTAADGTKIAYAVIGAGPLVLYVSGWPTHLEHEWAQPFSREFLLRLSRGCTLVRYDLRGSGLSDRDVSDFSIPSLLLDLEAVAAQLGEARFRVLSLGMLAGPVALAFAASRGRGVDHLALYGGYVEGAETMDPEARRRLVECTRRFGFPHFSFIDTDALDVAAHRAVRDVTEAGAPPAFQAALLETFFSPDLRALAPEVAVKTLVLHGTSDTIVPFECGRRLATLLPEATFRAIGGGTASPASAAEEIVAEIESFFGLAPGRPRSGAALTSREREVLELMVRGHANAEIGRALGISEKTVKSHVGHILSKLGARHRTEAVAKATTTGLIRS